MFVEVYCIVRLKLHVDEIFTSATLAVVMTHISSTLTNLFRSVGFI